MIPLGVVKRWQNLHLSGYRSGYRTSKPLISVAPTGNKLVPSPNPNPIVTLPINRRRSDWVRASGNRTSRHFIPRACAGCAVQLQLSSRYFVQTILTWITVGIASGACSIPVHVYSCYNFCSHLRSSVVTFGISPITDLNHGWAL